MWAGDIELRLFGIEARQVGNEIIGGVDTQQLGNVHRLLADEAGRIADTAHRRIFDQGLDGGGTRHADMDGKIDAIAFQHSRPFGHRIGFEQELRRNKALDAIGLEIGLFLLQGLQQHRFAVDLGDVRIALRMTGNADALFKQKNGGASGWAKMGNLAEIPANREATPEELAVRMEMPEDKVRKVLKIAKEPISMETPIGDDEDSHLGDFIEDSGVVSPVESATIEGLREATQNMLASLTSREAKVLRMRFGIDMNTDHTLEEVGKQFDVTRERIRQIEAKALRKLRHPTRSDKLRSFLDNES